eukprot:COSAG01_NODE_51481_length_354_cov_1.200000_1_plen_25_part_10
MEWLLRVEEASGTWTRSSLQIVAFS